MFYRGIFHQRNFRYLGSFYIHSIIRLFAISIFQIFISIYVYQSLRSFGIENQQAISLTSLFFALVFLVHALAVIPSLWIISKKGLRFSVFWGNAFLISFFISLYTSRYDLIFLVISGILGGLQIGLYWTAYHLYLAELTDDKKQGEEIAIGNSLSAIAVIGGPAFGGLVISYLGFGMIFIVMLILILIASFPLKYLPKQKDTVSIDILEIASALSPLKEKKSYIALLGVGVIDVVSIYFWPLYVFPILAGFIGVGFIGSLMSLISIITILITGLLIDRFGTKKVINIISSLDSILWVLRIFVITPLRVYLISGGQALTTSGQIITMDAMVYERARHNNLVAYIVQRETGLAVGKFIFLFVVGILFWFGMPLLTVFVITAFIALLTRIYPTEIQQVKSPS